MAAIEVEVPDFGALLAPYIGAVPEAAVPAFLARLERTAAARYRMWAESFPDHAEGLLACAAREDDIADRVERIYPTDDPAHIAAMEAAIAPARDTYYEVFSRMSEVEQLAVQAKAERQGAAAWRGMLADETDPVTRDALEQCARIEEASADYLDALLETLVVQH